jgi:acyl-CoA thioesterase-1
VQKLITKFNLFKKKISIFKKNSLFTRKIYINISIRDKHRPINIGLILLVFLSSALTFVMAEFFVYKLQEINDNYDVASLDLINSIRPSAKAADFNWYFANPSGTDPGNDCTNQNNPCRSLSKLNQMINSMTNNTDSANIYLKRGDTWTLTSSIGIRINRSNVTLTAYGSGALPIIDGNELWPNNRSIPVISIADGAPAPVSNVHISHLRIQDTHDGVSTREGGSGIIFAGSLGGANGTFTGNGSVRNCEIFNMGWSAVSIYRVGNYSGPSNAVYIENNHFSGFALLSNALDIALGGIHGGPQCINNNDSYSWGHIARYNRIEHGRNEGIGIGGFILTEYNVISDVTIGLHGDRVPIGQPATTQVVRYNLVWGDSSGSYSQNSGIRIDDETLAGNNTTRSIEIYGNTFIGLDGSHGAGIDIRNNEGYSHFGSIKVYNNTCIDNNANFFVQQSDEFDSVIFKNNASIIYNTANSSHFINTSAGWHNSDWSNWIISNNFYSGDGFTQESDLPTAFQGSNTFGTSLLGRTSGWRNLSSIPSLNDFTPQSGSDMIDNLNTDDTIDNQFAELLALGSDFGSLPANPTFTLANQNTSGSDWDFGAIIRGTGTTPPPTSGGTINILPLGDSITCGTNQTGDATRSYRYYLEDMLQAGSYDTDFIGSLTYPQEGLYTGMDYDHEGHPGYRADQIVTNLPAWLNNYSSSPDIVLLHIGHNDFFQSQTVDNVLSDIEDIVGVLRADNPAVTILIAQIIPTSWNGSNWDLLNSQIPALVSSLDNSTSRVYVVDQNTGYDGTLDNIDAAHPNETGNQKIAQRWFDALSSILSTSPTQTCTPNCTGKQCGDDGCSGSCGTCTAPATCQADGTCQNPSTPPPTPSSGSCHLYDSTVVVPTDFAAAYNPLSTQRELLLRTVCNTPNQTVNFTVGNGSELQFIWDKVYFFRDGAWQEFDLDPGNSKTIPKWIIGQGSKSIRLRSNKMEQYNHLAAYVCTYQNERWNCGCHDQACLTPYWNLQSFQMNVPVASACTDTDGDYYISENIANPASNCSSICGPNHNAACQGYNDCDDGNASINWDATEICNDNIDNNCHDGIDENCSCVAQGGVCCQSGETCSAVVAKNWPASPYPDKQLVDNSENTINNIPTPGIFATFWHKINQFTVNTIARLFKTDTGQKLAETIEEVRPSAEAQTATHVVTESMPENIFPNSFSPAAVPGDTIIIDNNRRSNIRFYNFHGTPSAPFTFTNQPNGRALINQGNTNGIQFYASENFFFRGDNNPNVEYGIEIDGSGPILGGVRMWQGVNWEVSYIHIHDTVAGITQNNNNDPGNSNLPVVWTPDNSMGNCRVHHNLIEDIGGAEFTEGMYLGKSRDADAPKWETLEIDHNRVLRTGSDGIQAGRIRNTGWLRIHDNYVEDPAYANVDNQDMGIIATLQVNNLEIYNNAVVRAAKNGIYVSSAGGTTNIHDNVIWQAGYMNTTYNPSVCQNYDSGCTDNTQGSGISVPHSASIINNTVVSSANNGIIANRDGTDGYIRYNLLINNNRGYTSVYSPANISDNRIQTGISGENFTNATQGDFSLTVNSPARNAGVGAGYSPRDFLGVSRPQATTADIGAFEFSTTPPTCTPDCSGKNCGDDGCSGTCGTCDSSSSCQNGVCAASPYVQATADCPVCCFNGVCATPPPDSVHYQFDEGAGTIAHDAFGNYDGTVNGASWTGGQIGQALFFDGVNDSVNIGDVQLLTNDLTISSWVRTANFSQVNGYSVSKYNTATNEREYAVYFNGPANEVHFLIGSSDGSSYSFGVLSSAASILTNNTWNHIVFTRSGSAAHCYINGVEQALAGTINSNNFADTTARLMIGNRTDGGRAFLGQIDDVRIYNRVLTAQEVSDLYDEVPTTTVPPPTTSTYNWYFSNSTGNDVTGNGTQASPWRSLAKLNAMLNTVVNGTESASIYLRRGDTWILTSNSNINIDKSNITIDAYGVTTAKPIIDGNGRYPNTTGISVISVGEESPVGISNVHVNNIRIQNTHDTVSTNQGGGGIIFAGTAVGGHFSGPGSVRNCEFYDLGWSAINIYGVPNSGGSSNAIKIENNYIHGTGWYPENASAAGTNTKGPQAINGNHRSYGHECRYNVIDLSHNEGIGATAFSIVEYNVVSNTDNPSIYFESKHTDETITSNIRYNLVWGDSSGEHGGGEIRVYDETASGDNTGITVNIYGNIVVGAFRGVSIKNQQDYSHFGMIRVFNNTFVDCTYNIELSRSQEFNGLDIRNNASIVYNNSVANHIVTYNCYSYPTNTTIGPNFYYGDAWISESDIINQDGVNLNDWRDGTNIFGNPLLGKTSGWRNLTAIPGLNDFRPQSGSSMIDNPNTDDTIGAIYSNLINSGEFTNLPNNPAFTLANQNTSGSDWDFGAIISGTASANTQPCTLGSPLPCGL